MSRRTSRQNEASVTLFPFLAVLICTMGTLIVLLVVVVQQAQQRNASASPTAAAPAPRVVDNPAKTPLPVDTKVDTTIDKITRETSRQRLGELETAISRQTQTAEDLHWGNEQLALSRDKTRQRLEEKRLELSRREDQVRQLARQLELLEKQATDLLDTEAGTRTPDAEVNEELARTQIEMEQITEEIEQTRELADKRRRQYAIIPYEGPHGTKRRPIYIECSKDRVVLQPEGLVFGAEDFRDMGPGNPLAAALRAVREYYSNAGLIDSVGEPYPLLVVRPGGDGAYTACRVVLRGWDDEFGYELLPRDIELAFPQVDRELSRYLVGVVERARELGGIPPPRQRTEEPWLASQDVNDSNNDRSGRAAIGNGAGGRFHPSGHGARVPGNDSIGGGGVFDFAAPGGGNHGGLVASDSGPGGAENGTGAATAVSAVRGGSASGQGSELSLASPNAPVGGPSLGLGTGVGGGASSQDDGQSSKGHRGDSLGGRGSTGSAEHVGTGRGTGGPAAGQSVETAADAVENQRGSAFPMGAPANGEMVSQGIGGSSRLGPSDILPPPDGMTVRDTTGALAGRGDPAAGAGGARGSASTGAVGMSQPGGAAGSFGGSQGPSPASNSQSVSLGAATSTATGAASAPRSIARTQGENWALPNAAGGAIGITRPIRVVCRQHGIALMPEIGNGQRVESIPFSNTIREAIQPFVAKVWTEIDRWGIAGPGVYWKPVLHVTVEPGAEQQFAEMVALLESSGLEIRRR